MGWSSSVRAWSWRLTQPPALLAAAVLLAVVVWIWAAHHGFVELDDPRVARIDIGAGQAQHRFVRDAQGQWRVASFDDVPADVVTLRHLLDQSLRSTAGPRQLPVLAWDARGQLLARGAVGRAQAAALLQRPYAPRLAKPPYLAPAVLSEGVLMGDHGPRRALAAAEYRKILHIINNVNPAAIRPGSHIPWRELVMVELRLGQGGRLYVQATHDGRWLWIRFAGNSAPQPLAGRPDMGQRFNDFRHFAYAIAPARWPASLLPSRPKCDPTLSPTPCPKAFP